MIVAGPFMPDEERAALHGLAAGRGDLRVLDFVPGAEALVGLADDVVAMAGYTTVSEVLASRSPALLVPRAEPRHEQVIRARRLSALGLVDMLGPDEADAAAISAWLAAGGGPRPAPRTAVDMNGLARVPGLLDDLVATPGARAAGEPSERRFTRLPARRTARTGNFST